MSIKSSRMLRPSSFGVRGAARDVSLLLISFIAAYIWLSSRLQHQHSCEVPTVHNSLESLPTTALEPSSSRLADIGILGMFYGDSIPPIYERTLANQRAYAHRHGYEVIMLKEKLMQGLWSKPAFILSTIIQELQKPSEQRLKWLFWLDTDIIIMNPNIPLDTYFPPPDLLEDINFIVANDEKGLNVGTFFVRVNSWSASLFGETLGLPALRPDVQLRFSDQSAVEWLLRQDRYRNQTMYVPQRWFNAYIGHRGDAGELKKATSNGVMEGDLLIHFAGKPTRAKSRLELYMDLAEKHLPEWEKPFEETGLQEELALYWEKEGKRRGRLGIYHDYAAKA